MFGRFKDAAQCFNAWNSASILPSDLVDIPAIPTSSELCQGICKLNDKVDHAVLIEDGILVAMDRKDERPVPIPSLERFKAIFFQLEFIARIHRSNEDFYGDLRFFIANFEGEDVLCFPLDKYGYPRKALLAFKVIHPYSLDELTESVSKYLIQVLGAPKS